MGAVAGLVVVTLALGYKEFLLVSFDPSFASVCALPTRWLQHLLMLLLAFAVVIALQAVGVVLVSAMLITPAATAYLLTDRMHRMLGLAAVIGLLAGVMGAFLSFLGSNLPTGPFMVLSASLLFALAFFFAPRRGVAVRWWQQRSLGRRVARDAGVHHLISVPFPVQPFLQQRDPGLLGGHAIAAAQRVAHHDDGPPGAVRCRQAEDGREQHGGQAFTDEQH